MDGLDEKIQNARRDLRANGTWGLLAALVRLLDRAGHHTAGIIKEDGVEWKLLKQDLYCDLLAKSCDCDHGQPCPLGRTVGDPRCTAEELAYALRKGTRLGEEFTEVATFSLGGDTRIRQQEIRLPGIEFSFQSQGAANGEFRMFFKPASEPADVNAASVAVPTSRQARTTIVENGSPTRVYVSVTDTDRSNAMVIEPGANIQIDSGVQLWIQADAPVDVQTAEVDCVRSIQVREPTEQRGFAFSEPTECEMCGAEDASLRPDPHTDDTDEIYDDQIWLCDICAADPVE